jgi:hypothetical protein
MTRIRAAVLLFVILIAAAVALVPAVRDELSWWWAESHDRSSDFMTYVEVWPNGRHVTDARLRYRQRQWVENEKALIHQAYEEAAHSSPEVEAEYLREKRLRQDSFFWKGATNKGTLQAYQDYLREFPAGQFAPQARARTEALSHSSQASPPGGTPPPQ